MNSRDRGRRVILPASGLALTTLSTRKQQQYMRSVVTWALVLDGFDEEEAEGSTPKVKRQRRVYPRPNYNVSTWAIMLRDGHIIDRSTRAARVLRRPLRIPYAFFMELVKIVEQREWFTLAAKNATGLEVVLIGLSFCCQDCFPSFASARESQRNGVAVEYRIFQVFFSNTAIAKSTVLVKTTAFRATGSGPGRTGVYSTLRYGCTALVQQSTRQTVQCREATLIYTLTWCCLGLTSSSTAVVKQACTQYMGGVYYQCKLYCSCCRVYGCMFPIHCYSVTAIVLVRGFEHESRNSPVQCKQNWSSITI